MSNNDKVNSFNYEIFKDNIKPLDLIFFKGNEFVSKTIRLLQKIKLGVDNNDDFSHVGMVVDTTIINKNLYPYLEDDKLYIFESTLSGKLSDGILNVENKSFFGTQVRDLEKVITKYNTKFPFGLCKLSNTSREKLGEETDKDKFKVKFTQIFLRYIGIEYNINLISLFAALFPSLRFLRDYAEKFFRTQGYLFCSELCFIIYQHLGLYSITYDARNILPIDFIQGILTKIPSNLFENLITFHS